MARIEKESQKPNENPGNIADRKEMFAQTRKLLDQYPDEKFVFICYNIDNFYLYRAVMGEKEGRRFLEFTGKNMQDAKKRFEHSCVGKIDETVFAICETYDEAELEQQLEKAQSVRLNYRDDYVIDASIGIYVISDNTENVESIFFKASMAANESKDRQGKKISFYKEGMDNYIKNRHWTVCAMKKALEDHEFQVYLQPKYDIRTELPCGAEALVRWIHPQKGMISPGQFIPLFESNGLIANLDIYMWEQVCVILQDWKQRGRVMMPVSVNMSRISLYNPRVVDILKGLIAKYDLEAEWLQLEVTESAYMSNPELMKATVQKLREAGFCILMDDFGSGYSSLNTLKEITVDILKIDMKFLPDGQNDVRGEKILSSVVRMAGWLDMPVIAEGVETREQKVFLESIGCGYVQGFYYARPMPVPDFEELIDRMDMAEIHEDRRDTFGNNDVIWSSTPQIDSLLRGISIPVIVLEYANGNIDLVRANKAYIDRFGGKTEKKPGNRLIKETMNTIRKTLERTTTVGKREKCEFQYFDESGACIWVRMKVQLIDAIEKAHMYCCTLTDITDEKKYEKQLKRIVELLDHQLSKKKLLVVDDQKLSRAIVSNIFGSRYEILEAENGRQALTLLAKYTDDISVILLDMVMPEMDGEHFLIEKNKIKQAVNIPVVVISTEKNPKLQVRMIKLGVRDYITKPFEPDIVSRRVENAIEYSRRIPSLLHEENIDSLRN